MLFKLLKAISYAIGVGCIFYAGGYGWALFFTKRGSQRAKVGNWSLVLVLLEVVIAFAYTLIGAATTPVGKDPAFMPLIYMLYIFLAHGAICVIGSLFFVVWYLITGGHDEDYDEEYYKGETD